MADETRELTREELLARINFLMQKVANRDEALNEAKEVLGTARRKMAELEGSRFQAIREMEAAREASAGALAREDEAKKTADKVEAERMTITKKYRDLVRGAVPPREEAG